ncbi:hypothetical protein BDM02DRAFT_3112804 [Thelephora ganbajun]|uniref:Uncharacterized protein n=1 Tax=Thelephora ganbajun TaxID=370292 RepID=A0ACB6ZKF2_THEGA|nr:hypothetical protein BDM02DRAFT_3112804 [Thelephora ganbajun]
MSLFSYAYTNEMTFLPLRTSVSSDYVADAEVQRPQPCSPRSIYSLAATVGVLCGYTTPSADTSNSLGSRISKRKR